jgi:folate-dependent phosphoribosylglycinamide formyltransferase PurN
VCPQVEFQVVTDRPCSVEDGCRDLRIPVSRVVDPDRRGFSSKAHGVLGAKECAAVIMLFSRVVEEPLTTGQRLLNIHPSLLPEFRGMGAVAKAYSAGVKVLGATLHVATAEVDGGPIVAQACQAIDQSHSVEVWEHVSFLQKTALFLLAVELLESGRLRWEGCDARLAGNLEGTSQMNPMLINEAYVAAVRRLQTSGPRFL